VEGETVVVPVNPECLVSVENFPTKHTTSMISKICEVFGKVKSVEQRGPGTVTVHYA
jgi:hypothetical protein